MLRTALSMAFHMTDYLIRFLQIWALKMKVKIKCLASQGIDVHQGVAYCCEVRISIH